MGQCMGRSFLLEIPCSTLEGKNLTGENLILPAKKGIWSFYTSLHIQCLMETMFYTSILQNMTFNWSHKEQFLLKEIQPVVMQHFAVEEYCHSIDD